MSRSTKLFLLAAVGLPVTQLFGCISALLGDIFFEVGPFLL